MQTGCTGYVHIAAIRMMRIVNVLQFIKLSHVNVMSVVVVRALHIHTPHLQSLPDWDSNTQPFNYESKSLTIRPRLHHGVWGSTHTMYSIHSGV